jgi:hypothetical protein
MELMANLGSVNITLTFLGCVVYLFLVIPYQGVRDLKRNFPHSHEHGLGIAKFLAFSVTIFYVIMYGMCLLSTSPYILANYGLSLIGAQPTETAWGVAFWFVVIQFSVIGGMLSILTMFLYTIAHARKKGFEGGNIRIANAIMTVAVVWVLLTEGYALFQMAQAMNTGARFDLFETYKVFVFSFNSVTPIMALFLTWVVLAIWLNIGRKTPAHA